MDKLKYLNLVTMQRLFSSMDLNIHSMFRIKTLLTIFIALAISGSSFAQDIHYTQYNMAPLSLNPSLTGAFEGTFRIGGLYRDQWRSVIDNQFVTPSVYLDAPAFRGIGKKDWVGLGVVLVNDKAGTVSLTNTSVMLGAAYHIGLGAEGNTVISLGGQGGIVQKRVDVTDAEFRDAILSGGTSVDLANINTDKVSYGDFNAGITLSSKLNSRMDFNLGFSLLHLSEPEYTTFTDAFAGTIFSDELNLPRRMVTHGQFNAGLTEKWVLSPSFLYQRMEGADEIAIQTLAGYHLNEAKDITLRFGAGYRLRDAVETIVGVDFKGLRVGVAYDVNVSDLTVASANRGGFEIAAAYIAKIQRAPIVKPIIFCPRF
jgi:type IX secretion system PorP/SprF family membrane protein